MPNPPPIPPSPEQYLRAVPAKKGLSGCALAAIIAVPIVFVIAVLAGMAVPVFNKIQAKAAAIKAAAKKRDPVPALTVPQREEFEKFIQQLLIAVQTRDAKTLDSMMDYNALASDAFSGFENAAAMQAGFKRGILKNPGGIFVMVMGQTGRFVRHNIRDGVPAATLRFSPPDGGIVFLDVMVNSSGGGFKIIDLYNYTFGMFVSREIAQNTALLSGNKNSALSRLLGLDKTSSDDAVEKIIKLTSDFKSQKFKEVISSYDSFPSDLKKARVVFICYLQALQALSEQTAYEARYIQALMDAKSVLGPESATDLLMIDLHFIKQDFPAARKDVENLIAMIGDDASLLHLLGNISLKLHDVAGAENALQRAEKAEPELPELVDLRLQIMATKGNFSELVAELRRFADKTHALITPDTLSDSAYDEFKKSPEFAEWARSVESKSTGAGR